MIGSEVRAFLENVFAPNIKGTGHSSGAWGPGIFGSFGAAGARPCDIGVPEARPFLGTCSADDASASLRRSSMGAGRSFRPVSSSAGIGEIARRLGLGNCLAGRAAEKGPRGGTDIGVNQLTPGGQFRERAC